MNMKNKKHHNDKGPTKKTLKIILTSDSTSWSEKAASVSTDGI
jgi:hypothetical protein